MSENATKLCHVLVFLPSRNVYSGGEEKRLVSLCAEAGKNLRTEEKKSREEKANDCPGTAGPVV
jgi:hypothetical protein